MSMRLFISSVNDDSLLAVLAQVSLWSMYVRRAVLHSYLGSRRTVRSAASPRSSRENLAFVIFCSPPVWRLDPRWGGFPLPGREIGIGEQGFPVSSVWLVERVSSSRAPYFLNRKSLF